MYLKAVGGTPHVFVSRLIGGSFQPPVQVDSGLAGPSSEPVIAAGNAGLLLVAFINGSQLYAVQAVPAGFGAPVFLAGGAVNPAISMTNVGKAYVVFAVADGSGHDVRSAYYYKGRWALESPPLNATPADNAGTGSGRPVVAAAGDGIGVVAWGENGHIYSRRVWATAASVVDEQADAPPAGCSESSADDPVIGASGDSSYAPVAFQELVTCGGHQQSRVLMNRLHGSVFDGITQPDGLSGAPADGATDPQIAVTEYGEGWVTSARTVSANVLAGWMSGNGAYAGSSQINSLSSIGSPYPVPAIAGLNATYIAWQQEPGSAGGGEIRVRYAGTAGALGPETIVSSPVQGPTDAADGIAADGDLSGDAAVAWLQGPPGATQVMVAQMYQPPGTFSSLTPSRYANRSQPVLAWSTPLGWGPLRYSLIVDGTQIGQAYSTSVQLPVPVPDGPHAWRVTAANPAGQRSQTGVARIFVDTVAPTARIKLLGRATAGSQLLVSIGYGDHPPAGEPGFDASGVAQVTIDWGDGLVRHAALGMHIVTHAYQRPGRYKITLVVTDKAGNMRRVVKKLKVVFPGQAGKASTKGGAGGKGGLGGKRGAGGKTASTGSGTDGSTRRTPPPASR